MKRDIAAFIAVCAAGFVLTAGNPGLTCAAESAQKQTEEKKVEQISDEDKEAIELMDMLKNLDLFDKEDIELFKNLDVLTANE